MGVAAQAASRARRGRLARKLARNMASHGRKWLCAGSWTQVPLFLCRLRAKAISQRISTFLISSCQRKTSLCCRRSERDEYVRHEASILRFLNQRQQKSGDQSSISSNVTNGCSNAF